MAKKNISIKTYEALVNEIGLAKDPHRTLNSISDKNVKEIMTESFKYVSSNPSVVPKLVGGLSTAGLTATLGGIIGTAGATAGATAGGAVAAGTVTSFIVGGSAATAAVAGAEAGGVAGALGGPIGIAIGAAVGLTVGAVGGVIATKSSKKKQEARMEAAYHKLLAKQNREIKELQKEAQILAKKINKTMEDNERLKYLLSTLTANENLMKVQRG